VVLLVQPHPIAVHGRADGATHYWYDIVVGTKQVKMVVCHQELIIIALLF
jgi:hypothetical protein